jgi:hypothetical protein
MDIGVDTGHSPNDIWYCQIKIWARLMIPSREEDQHACSSYSLRP